jgi:hypothetical protein
MRAVLVNVYDRTIMAVEFDGTLKGMYGLLRCGIVQPIRFVLGGDLHHLWIDEEGALKVHTPTFVIDGFRQPLAGSGLVCGSTPEGELADATATVEQIDGMVRFMDLMTTGQFTGARMAKGNGQPFDYVIDMGKPLFTAKGDGGEK